MKIPFEWLKDFVDIKLRPEELAEKLTLAGLEVGAIEYHGKDIEGVVVGKVKTTEKLASDHHLICQIDIGKKLIQVITDDLTVQAGDRVPVAPEGATISGGITVTKTALHGVETFGYLCKPHELGLYQENYVLRLPKYSVLGDDVRKYLGSGGCVLDVDVLPNRGDCQSIIGIAREVAAVLDKKLKIKSAKIKKPVKSAAKLPITITVKNKDLCPRYMAKMVTNVVIKESPAWLKDRLMLLGMRPINNVVDTTNYLLAELGQPMHAFDADLISGGKIIVREAARGETIRTLDGVERKLEAGMLVIADEEHAVALAGVMGGVNSEVSSITKNILLESACFDPVSISKTSKAAKLRTEASVRFEKGVDWNMIAEALEKAAAMIAELSGGIILDGAVDIKIKDRKPKKIELRAQRIKKILGVDLSLTESIKLLGRLGFKKIKASKERAILEAPLYRAGDIEREIDLIEELARIMGYDRIDSTMPKIARSEILADHAGEFKYQAEEILVGCGMMEVVTFSLVDPGMASADAVKISNPMTNEESVMRTALLPGLLKVLSHNLRHQVDRVRIFEIGKVFIPKTAGSAEEKVRVAGILAEPNADFLKLKGIIESLVSAFTSDWSLESVSDNTYHPGKSAGILIGPNKKLLGKFGALHPEVTGKWDIKEEVFGFELDCGVLIEACKTVKRYRPLPKFPNVERDLAMFVPAEVRSSSIVEIIRQIGGPMVEEVYLFDRYKDSQAYHISFREAERTLTDDEVNRQFEAIMAELEKKLQVKIRK